VSGAVADDATDCGHQQIAVGQLGRGRPELLRPLWERRSRPSGALQGLSAGPGLAGGKRHGCELRRLDAHEPDRTAGGRLALWGRRLLGEALSQAQAVAVERDAMSALLVGGGVDLAEVGQMFTRLTDNHTARMQALGLQS